MFVIRSAELAVERGRVGMITMQSWMFLSSFEELRDHLLSSFTLENMAHLGPRAFDTIKWRSGCDYGVRLGENFTQRRTRMLCATRRR